MIPIPLSKGDVLTTGEVMRWGKDANWVYEYSLIEAVAWLKARNEKQRCWIKELAEIASKEDYIKCLLKTIDSFDEDIDLAFPTMKCKKCKVEMGEGEDSKEFAEGYCTECYTEK